MSFLFRRLVRPILFELDSEWIHDRTIAVSEFVGGVGWAIRWLRRYYKVDDERLEVSVGDIVFDNPIGLAAGFDKNGLAPLLVLKTGVRAHPRSLIRFAFGVASRTCRRSGRSRPNALQANSRDGWESSRTHPCRCEQVLLDASETPLVAHLQSRRGADAA